MIENIKILTNSLKVRFKNKYEENYPNIWLRDHIKDEKNWDKRSHQRKTYTASLDIGIQIKQAKIKNDGSHLEILWSDMENVVKYSSEYLVGGHNTALKYRVFYPGLRIVSFDR